ncbi:hypothetical protein C1H46_004942 [Malus baccata]|uniref:Uncharacterized protein n=1 Tax=Malus baccata TaxID=106549 RepID=A0A540NEI7_MALBA|nr:hypothetical protein C1H46_004942 [Malus baccata]
MLEFDSLAVVDEAIEDEVAKIRAAKEEVLDKQTLECEVVAEGMMVAGEPKVI